MLGPGFTYLVFGLICMFLGPCAAILASVPRHPAKSSVLGLVAYLLGLSAGSVLGWWNEDLITMVINLSAYDDMPIDLEPY